MTEPWKPPPGDWTETTTAEDLDGGHRVYEHIDHPGLEIALPVKEEEQ